MEPSNTKSQAIKLQWLNRCESNHCSYTFSSGSVMILYQFVYFKKNYTSPTDFVQNYNKLIYLPIRLLSIVSIFCTFAEPT